MPKCSGFRKGGYNYVNDDLTDNKGIITLDKRRAYTYALTQLPFLITCDIRTSKHTKNPKKIKPENLYIIKNKKSSLLLPNCELYSGDHLIYCQSQELEFELLEELEGEKKYNFYPKMVEDLYKNVDNEELKSMFNVYIGKMEKDIEIGEKNNSLGIFTKDEADTMNGHEIQLGKYIIKYEIEDIVKNLYNRLPINIQIKDMNRRILYEKIKELGIEDKDIVQIKTDSISYIGKPPKKEQLGEDDYTGWKLEKFEKINEIPITEKSLSFLDISSPLINDNNTLCLCYAGSGKSYHILNTVIPSIKPNKTYLILSPTYVSLEEYRERNLNIAVIQKYTLQNKIPKEDIIIIDECSMIDQQGQDLIIKMALLGKLIYMYGDFNQLEPVEPTKKNPKEYNSQIYLNLIFKNKLLLTDNYRNHFTKEYYDTIINSNSTKYLEQEVKKHSTKTPKEAEVIICYLNATVDKYNDLMMKENKQNKYSEGLPIICKSNDLLDNGLYNGMTYKIKSVDKEDKKLIIKDNKNNEYTINNTQYEENFKPAYALTIHCTQGKSITKYYYADEDYKYLDNKKAYVIVSRLKTK